MSSKQLFFPGFEHPANHIKRYTTAVGIFTMLLIDGAVVHHEPGDTSAFLQWLQEHQVSDTQTDF